jgi:hypothetical protein
MDNTTETQTKIISYRNGLSKAFGKDVTKWIEIEVKQLEQTLE